jgi:CIC family chloride channel protein
MRAWLEPFIASIKNLAIIRQLPEFFDATERRLVVQAGIVGVVVWAFVFTLKQLVHHAFEWIIRPEESGHALALLFIPMVLGALLVAAITGYRAATIHFRDSQGKLYALVDAEGDGLERAISLYFSSEPALEQTLLGAEGVDMRWQMPTFSLAIRKFLATFVTLGCGGSGGLEGSVTLIGESVAAGLFKPRALVERANTHVGLVGRIWNWWQTSTPDDLQTAQLGGIAAAVSALLGAPFAAGFFAVEVMYRRRPIIEKLIYALISSLVSYFLTNVATGGHTTMFEVENLPLPPNTLRFFVALLILSVLISMVSLYFKSMKQSIERWFFSLQIKRWQRHVLGALITGGIAYVVTVISVEWLGYEEGLTLVLGTGEIPLMTALRGELPVLVALLALFAKLLAVLMTIGSGGSAGFLVPSLYLGTMVATIVAHLFGFPPVILIVPAMAASLVSIANVPLAAMLFVVEVFGAPYLLPALISLIVTILLAVDVSIYRSQREKYDERQILPGYSVRRVTIPTQWANKTIVDLRIRNRYGLNVIGLIENQSRGGEYYQQVRLNPDMNKRLREGDILVVLGRDVRLNEFEARLVEETLPN